MKNRYELFANFCAFYAEIHTQFHVFVQSLRSDNAKEYVLDSFSHSCFKMRSFIRPLALIPLSRMEWLREKIDTSLKMESFIRLPALIPLPRMKWLRKRIDTSLKLPKLYYFKCMCPNIFGPMLFLSLVF